MPVISIPIGRSKYHIDCPEVEKEKLLKLAEKVNEKVNNLALMIRDVDEKTLLVISMLNIEDELQTALQSLQEKTKDGDIKNIAQYLQALKVRIDDKF